MKAFDKFFFGRYLPESQKILGVVHSHWLVVIRTLIIWLSFGLFLPCLFYAWSERIQNLIPFLYLEYFLFFVFIKIFYEIMNWYLDAWVLTNEAVYDIEWSFFKINVSNIRYENIEGIQSIQEGIVDKIFGKGVLIIHKIGDDSFALEDAVIPYDVVEIIQKQIAGKPEDDGEEENIKNKFDKMIDVLSQVVNQYLENSEEKVEKIHTPKPSKKNLDEKYTIDISG